MVRVGIIGAGIIAESHLEAIAQHPDSQLCAIADIVPGRAEAAAKPYGAAAYTDYIEMLDSEKPDVAIINLPHFLHESCALECAGRGIHTLLEKPMAMTEGSCQRINAAFEQSGALLQIGHVQRYIQVNRKAKQIIDSGELGRIVMLDLYRTAKYFTPSRPRWFLKKETAGGGMWMNLGAHCLDKTCFLTDSTIDSLTGQCIYAGVPEEADVDAGAQAFVRLSSGITATVTVCGCNAMVPGEQINIHMTKGSLRIHGSALRIYRDGKEEAVDIGEYPAPFVAQWTDFMQGLKQGKVLCNDGKYAAHIVRHIESLYK